jgi:hypothetical protein
VYLLHFHVTTLSQLEGHPVKAIARIAKLKGNGLSASELHTSRQRDTPNANPGQSNQRIVGAALANDTLEQLVRQRVGPQRIRKDAVLCVELLLSVSPEYCRPLEPSRAGYWEVDKLERFQWTVQQWLSQTYGDRIIRAELHLDEATPHIHAYLVPLDERGKLNCKGLFGSREQLRQFQDSYAQALESLGVERGIRGSRATHTAIQAYYGAVMRKPDLTLEPEAVQYQLADRARAFKERDELEQTARALERENAVLRQRVPQQEQTVQRWATVVQEVRSLPLETVAAELGLESDIQRPQQWRSAGFDININGSKFYDWAVLKGGGGAIDLVMHVEQCGFRKAVVWLRDRFGAAATMQAATEQVQEIFQAEPSHLNFSDISPCRQVAPGEPNLEY